MISGTKALEVIAELLLPVFPPYNPLVKKDWSGFAFDRNRYEDLAPSEVWLSLFSQHVFFYQPQMIFAVAKLQDGNDVKELVAPQLYALREYWDGNAKFLRDHYVLSEGGEWVVRLDQDVTLFAGRSSFMRAVANGAGGAEFIKKIMKHEFDDDAESSLGLKAYVEALTKGLT